MDIFEKYLKENQDKESTAFNDSSYNNYRKYRIKKNDSRFDDDNKPLSTNEDLATYGDAVIKLSLCEILYGKVEQLTVEKQKYESDKFFVEVIAKHYHLLNYINFDRRDSNIPQDYDYSKYGTPDNNSCKYIATAVEAIVGDIYMKNKNIDEIKTLLNSWIEMSKKSDGC